MAGAATAAGVVVVGSFNVDHVWHCATLPRPGETLAGTYASGPGGKGFNQAVASARAGGATTFVCALGEDAGAQLARALAVAERTHEGRCRPRPGETRAGTNASVSPGRGSVAQCHTWSTLNDPTTTTPAVVAAPAMRVSRSR